MHEILKKRFNYSSFKPHQLEIIQASVEDKDVFAILQTGYGKSICYQFLSFFLPGIIIIISPLKSLIYDQVSYLRDKNISVEYLTSDQKEEVRDIIYDKCRTIPGLLLYTTPETIEKNAGFGAIIDEL
jgi:superfamily II DNA helicase RecQ